MNDAQNSRDAIDIVLNNTIPGMTTSWVTVVSYIDPNGQELFAQFAMDGTRVTQTIELLRASLSANEEAVRRCFRIAEDGGL